MKSLVSVLTAGMALALAAAAGVAYAQTPSPTPTPTPMATATGTATPSPTAAPTVAPCPAATVVVTAPTAAAPTTVSVTVTPALNIRAATDGDATSFHLHYFVDTPATAAGQVVPLGAPRIIHTSALTQSLGTLAPGVHTVEVVLEQLNHTACAARGAVTFTVAAPTQAATPSATAAAATATPSAPRTGQAGLSGSSPAASAVLALFGIATLLVGGSRLATGWRR